MKIAAIKELSDSELKSKAQDLKQETLNLRIQQQSGRLEKPSRITEIRKTVARIETVLGQRTSESAKK